MEKWANKTKKEALAWMDTINKVFKEELNEDFSTPEDIKDSLEMAIDLTEFELHESNIKMAKRDLEL
ncbi:MAG: hypothetical protein IJV42_02000 [Bacteroidaceae bacterium]|nr:hypothetical protein [Bacteroidaceae bacterium]